MLAGLVIDRLVTNTYFQSITTHWLNRTDFVTKDLWFWRLERLVTSALVTSGGSIVFLEALFFKE